MNIINNNDSNKQNKFIDTNNNLSIFNKFRKNVIIMIITGKVLIFIKECGSNYDKIKFINIDKIVLIK